MEKLGGRDEVSGYGFMVAVWIGLADVGSRGLGQGWPWGPTGRGS